MGQPALYDEDILIWSEEQASIIRRLGRQRRDLPNEFDIENVAEEIESVGRSELAAVESQLQNILAHLIKIAVGSTSDPVRHWRAEIVAFHAEVQRRYAPSMYGRIDIDKVWKLVRRMSILAAEDPKDIAAMLPERCPLKLDDLLAEDLNSEILARQVRSAAEDKAG